MSVIPIGPNPTLNNDYYPYNTQARKRLIEQSFNNALIISTDLDLDYLPLFAMFRGKHSHITKDGEELRYSTYWLDPSMAPVKLVSTIVTAFNTYVKPIQYNKEGIAYYIQKHCIYTIVEGQVIVLFCTIVKKDYWRLISENFEIDPNQFLMVVNSEFLTPRYKAFYTYFTKSIMNPLLLSERIDFVITSDITKYCFKPIETPIQFTTISEMKIYLNTISDGATNQFIAETG